MIYGVEAVETGNAGCDAHAPYLGCVCGRFDEDHHGESEESADKLDDAEAHYGFARADDVFLQPWGKGRHEGCAHWEVGTGGLSIMLLTDSVVK